MTSWLASSLLAESITAHLPNKPYSFPQQGVYTDSRPDIVAWNMSAITIIELTVPFELCVDSAVARKTERYAELLGTCRDADYKANLLTLGKLVLEVLSTPTALTSSTSLSLPQEPNGRWHVRACYSPSACSY